MTLAVSRDDFVGAAMPPQARSRGEAPVILMSVDAVGGVWRYAMELARALPAHGYRVVFAVLGPAPSVEQEAEARRLGDLVWLDQPLDWMVDGPERLSTVGPALAALADDCGASLVQLNAPSQVVGLDVSVPVVSVVHSCLPTWWKAVKGTQLPRAWRWHQRANQAGMEASDAVVVPSGSYAHAVAECYKRPLGLEVAYNGIAAFLPAAPREPFLFAAGRWWDEGKNGAVLAGAAASIDWPVVMAGPLESPTGQRLELSGVRTPGAIPHDGVLDHARRAGIVVSPSIYEPFGLAALEGARAGAALLLADIPTYRELWKGAALFFDPADPADLAAKANLLIRDDALRTAQASMALARSRRFTPDRQARTMSAIYSRCMEKAAPAATEAL
jgi:glycosyltransferase involved in cell wall biosynthesis